MALPWTRDIRAYWSPAELCTPVVNTATESVRSEENAGSSHVLRRSMRTVALLSPTSGNLGNAAMQRAMIANLRKRIAGVEIYGITLNPEETRRRHGIEAFPLAGASLPHYAPLSSTTSSVPTQQTSQFGRTRQRLKEIPLLRFVVRRVKRAVFSAVASAPRRVTSRISRFIHPVAKELEHIRGAARFARGLDCIIVPGGGALDDFWGGPWGQPWALFKWSLLSRLIGVPFLFVSIGKCSLDRRLSRFFAGLALRFATYRSYRDPVSKKAAQALIDSRNDKVYPDLAFSYPVPVIRGSSPPGSEGRRLVVGVSPIAYCDPRTWPRKDEIRYTAYVSRLTAMVRWLIKEGHGVFFFTTDGPDTTTVADVEAALCAAGTAPDTCRTLPGAPEQTPDGLLRDLSSADLIVASRLHGVILSHLNGIPVLALSFDPKVDAHMDAIGQRDFCLDIDDLQLEAIVERFRVLSARRKKEAAHIRWMGLSFREQLDEQYDRLFGAVGVSPVKSEGQNQTEITPMDPARSVTVI